MDNFSFARRTDWRQEANALNKALENLRKRGSDLLDLTNSNPTNCGFAYPPPLLSVLSSSDNLLYHPEAHGLKDARQAVAKYYARQKTIISPHHIILTASTSEAYSFLMRLLVNPGERVLVPKPSYPLFQYLLEINDVHFDYYPLYYKGQWRLDTKALQRLVAQGKPRAVILVNPNNPTGSYIASAELAFLNELCRQHQVSIISDEVFFDYALGPGDHVSLAGNQAALTFVLGGLSKSLALPQMKCAWILASGPPFILPEALSRLEIIADTYLSVNSPVQNALGIWLKKAPQIQAQIIARLRENYHWLQRHLNHHAQLLLMQGGWYAILRIPEVKSEEEWALAFLQEDHVLVYPGYFFDFDHEAYMVLSLLPSVPVFREAAGRMMQRLASI